MTIELALRIGNMIPWHKSFLGILAIAIAPTLVGFSNWHPWSPSSGNGQEIGLQFPPTSGSRGAPKTTTGGGTRSDGTSCLMVQEGEVPLVALMPNRENEGQTATDTPTLYWYVPQTTATEGEFVVIDSEDNELYQTTFALPSQPGIVKLTIPAAASLKPDTTYTWSFAIVCDSRYRNRDQYVEGEIEYTKLDEAVETQLKTADSLKKAKLYSQFAIWYETLHNLAQIRANNPTEWQELLQSVGLEILVNVPFADCCTPKN